MSDTPSTPPGEPDEKRPSEAVRDGSPPDRLPLIVSLVSDDDARRARQEKVERALAEARPDPLKSAEGDGRTRQGSLLLMVPIRDEPENIAALEKLLDRIANPPRADEDFEANEVIPFARLRTVHFARILIHYASPRPGDPLPEWGGKVQAKGPPIPPKLLFSTDFDGPLDEHLDELLDVAGPGLDAVFGHCVGWPGSADRRRVHDFAHLRQVRSNTFYTGTMRRSVDQIRREAELHDRVQAYLDQATREVDFPADPVAARDRVRAWVAAQPELEWAEREPGPFPRPVFPTFVLDHLLPIAIVVLLALAAAAVWALDRVLPLGWAVMLVAGPLLALGAAAWAAWSYLGRLSATDPVIIGNDVDRHTARLVETEDRIVQNEMSSVIYIKEPLWFRGAVLRAVLAFIDLSARYLSNTGNLAGIPSIHFARWVVVDEGRRLVFFSNFDGSWDNYLGDFIDKSSQGLTAVWSNCVGFPRTVGLLREGATDEQKFKAYSRDSQIATQVWYSAYRWLSVSNINNNSKIRLGLHGTMSARDAEAWLRRFADGGERAAKPTIDDKLKEDAKNPPPPHPPVEVADVQGLVARSFQSLRHAAYVPAVFGDGAGARAWVGGAVETLTPAARRSAEVRERGEARNLAFTSDGLRALELPAAELATFSREFQEGMAGEHRSRALGDTGAAAPAHWRWGGTANPVHAMLFLFARTPEGLAALLDEERARAAAHGVALGTPLDTIMLEGDKEHFGFHDGIAQPRISGLTEKGGGEIPAGEVILGYPNAYGKTPFSPSVPDDARAAGLAYLPVDPDDPPGTPRRRDLGRNGSYVAFRQMEQDVRHFWEDVDRRAEHDAAARRRLAAKMVGRWPNGAPLVRHPDQEPAEFDAATANRFYYTGSWDDQHGDKCPVSAHIRRTNPRDGMMPNPRGSLVVAGRHRLLRRGRAYGPPVAPSFEPADILAAPDDGKERGLHFICFNSDLVRQFEFVQSTWVNSAKFDGLYTGPDPVIAPHADPATEAHPERISSFTEPRCPVRHRETELPSFVTLRGGAYLFMPGLAALRYLATFR